MKIWMFLGLLSIFVFSSECAVEKEKVKFRRKHHNHHHHHLRNQTQNSQNHFFENKKYNTAKSISKNIILIIVEDNQGEDSWKELKKNYSFPIQGFLSNCYKSKLPNNSSILIENKQCHCNKLLKENINELLTWADLVKKMDTATISGGNFTFSSIISHEHSIHVRETVIGNLKNGSKPTVLRIKPESGNFLRLNNTNNHSTLLSSISTTPPSIPISKNSANDAFWNFINTVSQMHLSFFKTIFDALKKQFPHDQISPSHKSAFSVKPPKFTDLIFNTLMNLKLTSNEKGFLFIIVTPGNQLSEVYRSIQHEIPINNTLMVITGKCSRDGQDIPYIASGLQPHFLQNISAIFELPMALKLTLNSCHGVCNNKTFPLTVPVDTPKKRVARSGDYDEIQQDDDKAEESDSDINGSDDSMNDIGDPDFDPARDDSSTSSCITSSLALEFILTIAILFIKYV